MVQNKRATTNAVITAAKKSLKQRKSLVPKTKIPRPARVAVAKKKISRKAKSVDTAPKSQLVVVQDKLGHVDKYTKSQLKQLRDMKIEPPENYVQLTKPNTVIFSNDPAAGGLENTWEPLAEASIMAHQAHGTKTILPVGPAVLKAYLWWAFFSRHRRPEVQGIRPGFGGNPADYSFTVIPDFDEKNLKVPVGFAKFIHATMPYTDPSTGAHYQYVQFWDHMFTGYSISPLPTFSDPSIRVDASNANVWNRSVFQNSNLRWSTLPTGTGVNGEYYTAINPQAESPTFIDMVDRASEISTWFDMTGATVEMSRVPFRAFDGTFYSVVSSAASKFPGIYSNIKFVDDELSYIYHNPMDPAVDLDQNDQVFRQVLSLPAVLPQVVPTNIPATYPAQYMMILNYAHITRMCSWANGGRKMLLRTVDATYKGLRSFKPNYFIADLNAWHQMVEEAAETIFQNYAAANGGTLQNDVRTNNTLAALLTTFESALFANAIDVAWPSLVLFSSTDFASAVSYSSMFRTIELPPLLADYISGLKPNVSHGVLYVPLLDFRPASTISSGTSFWGLTSATDQINGRWFYRLSPNDSSAAGVTVGQPYYEMYTPSTGAATSSTPPSSQDRVAPFATSLFVSSANSAIQWGNTVLSQAVVYNAALSPVVPVSASRYIGSTPQRYAHDCINQYRGVVGQSDNSFFPVPSTKLGLFASFNPTVAISATVFPNNAFPTAVGAVQVTTQLVYQVDTVGSIFPLDVGSVGRSAVYAYKRIKRVQQMPFANTVASAINPVSTLMANTLRLSSFNQYNNAITALMNHGLTQLQAVRALLEQEFKNVAAEVSVHDYHVGDAMVIIQKAIQDITVAPYHEGSNLATTTFNSPTLYTRTADLAKTGGVMTSGSRIPIIDPVKDFLNDLWSLL